MSPAVPNAGQDTAETEQTRQLKKGLDREKNRIAQRKHRLKKALHVRQIEGDIQKMTLQLQTMANDNEKMTLQLRKMSDDNQKKATRLRRIKKNLVAVSTQNIDAEKLEKLKEEVDTPSIPLSAEPSPTRPQSQVSPYLEMEDLFSILDNPSSPIRATIEDQTPVETSLVKQDFSPSLSFDFGDSCTNSVGLPTFLPPAIDPNFWPMQSMMPLLPMPPFPMPQCNMQAPMQMMQPLFTSAPWDSYPAMMASM